MTWRRYGWAGFLIATTFIVVESGGAADDVAAEKPAARKTAQTVNPLDQPYSRGGADTCLGCHDDEVTLGVFKNPHGVPTDGRTPFGHDQLQCESCHGPGGNHARRVKKGEQRPEVVRFGRDATTPVETQNGMCSACHQADLGATWHGGAHANNDIACADCHDSHTARDPMLTTSTQSETCGTCHTTTRMAQHKAFTHPIEEGKMTCSSCHDAHGAPTDAELIRTTTNDTCYGCHADMRGPFVWEHAPVAEDCTLCHEPHGSSHPGMLKQRGPMLCQNCHSEQGHPSIAPTPGTTVAGSGAGGAVGGRAQYVLGMNCLNCHTQVHGSNHPSGSRLMR